MVKKIKYILAAGGVLALSTGLAQAQGIKPYVGVGVGVFGLTSKAPASAFGPGINQKNNVFGAYVKAGADVNDYLGFELRLGSTSKGSSSSPDTAFGLNRLGQTTPISTSIQASYFLSYLVKLQYPVSSAFHVHALVGATTVRGKFNISGVSATTIANLNTAGYTLNESTSATKTAFSYGLGADYMINNQLSAGAEWMQYGNNVDMGSGVKASMWGLTADVSYHF